ncbi:MAG: threonine synthase [Chlorobi bacterium]|nr:threonine synthase [Chlorobiota bacterium]
MKFYSTNNKEVRLSVKEAVIKGLASDNGLFMPEVIPVLPESFFKNIEQRELPEIAFEVLKPFFTPDIPENKFLEIVQGAFTFDIPLKNIENSISVLELFHGPTSAFKDVGARFLARVLSWFVKDLDREVYVLAATSGDTGGAVANGFYNVEGVKVVVLYPSGMVSERQEKQFTTLGNNISALEIKGTFDDCQKLVKGAFLDEELNSKLFLTSANSINIARLLPQMVYYFYAYAWLKNKNSDLVVSVPSGNFGNLTAGVIAYKMGLPVNRFVAATNINDVVPQYLETGKYTPRTSVQTLANAMDVGDPSNFVRLLDVFGGDREQMNRLISGYVVDDKTIKKTIKDVYDNTGYVLDPHGACAYTALKALKKNPAEGVFLATAHPAKFPKVVEEQTGKTIPVPEEMKKFMSRNKQSFVMNPSSTELKKFLMK